MASRSERCRPARRLPEREQAQALVEALDQPVEPERRGIARQPARWPAPSRRAARTGAHAAPVEQSFGAGRCRPLDEQRHRVAVAPAVLGVSDSPGTAYTHSNGARSAIRLVATIRSDGQPSSSCAAHVAHGVERCSQLSSRITASLSASDAATTASRERPSRVLGDADRGGDSGDDHPRVGHVDELDEPAAVAPACGEVARRRCSARRVLPTPPGPATVTIRCALTSGQQRGTLAVAPHEGAGRCDRPAPRRRSVRRLDRLGVSGEAAAVREPQLAHQRRDVATRRFAPTGTARSAISRLVRCAATSDHTSRSRAVTAADVALSSRSTAAEVCTAQGPRPSTGR